MLVGRCLLVVPLGICLVVLLRWRWRGMCILRVLCCRRLRLMVVLQRLGVVRRLLLLLLWRRWRRRGGRGRRRLRPPALLYIAGHGERGDDEPTILPSLRWLGRFPE